MGVLHGPIKQKIFFPVSEEEDENDEEENEEEENEEAENNEDEEEDENNEDEDVIADHMKQLISIFRH